MIYLLFIFLVLSIIAVVFAISIIIGLVRTGGVPFISTPRKDFDNILQAVKIQSGQTICDLGCGNAGFIIRAAKKYGAKGVGYELSLWPYVWARFNIWLSRVDVKIYMKDFFQADLSNADVVFCYLFPEIMKKLELQFEQKLKLGAKVVSYGFKLPNKKPDEETVTNDDRPELGRIYVYQF